MGLSNRILAVFFFVCSYSYGQVADYSYKRELTGISEQWHKIVLLDAIFGKISEDMHDLRVFGITAAKDTIEAPYLLRMTAGQSVIKQVAFKTLNTSHDEKGHYFTFEIPSTEPVNQIKLDFEDKNFDWRIRLEGSHDQRDWFTILENFRVLSIKNEHSDFQYNSLHFPDANYRYFRVLVDSKEKPTLSSASISQRETSKGTFRDFGIRRTSITENKKTKQTEIDIMLDLPVRVSHLKIDVKDSFDFFRPISIKAVADSTKSEKGWIYNYRTLASGTLNSIDNAGFEFESSTVQQLKIFIDNQDNQPLNTGTIEVKGYEHELTVRFSEPAAYYLVYGNPKASRPRYDIARFPENVPSAPKALTLGSELEIEKTKNLSSTPLFENKAWLWAIMGFIIVLLGWFSIRMMRKG